MVGYRADRVKEITNEVGVYVLCDLDEVPVYVGRSVQGIRGRVQRHLTSARSDVIANRQIDVWEIAYVWAYPVARENIPALEQHLFARFHAESPLMNGQVYLDPGPLPFPVPEPQRVQVMTDEEIEIRKHPSLRLPRQAQHYERLLDQIVNVKDAKELRQALVAHFDRLQRYHRAFLEPYG
ncbi:MAG: GIY-YIG nuclease family protein [Dehalococcoidia bacterium]